MKERIMAYEGSCHCGAVTYTVEGDIPDTAMSCNCSHCRRKGFLLTFVPIDQFRLTGGADRLTSYMFNKHNIDHQFRSEDRRVGNEGVIKCRYRWAPLP